MNRHAKAPSAGSSTREGSRLGRVVRGAFATRGASSRAKGSGAPSTRLSLILASAAALLALALPAIASAATPPTISNLVVSELTTGSAHFSAEIDPGGATAEFDTAWHFECVPSCSGLTSGTVFGAAEEVENDATGLQPATFYTVRLIASNSGGERKATATFTTPGAAPLVKAWAAGPIAPTSADINAQIDPQGSATTYWFEWGSEDCAVATCASIPPLHEAFAGSGSTYTYVFRHLSGLSPSTTYHFRVVAKNASGLTEGPDRTFTTAAPTPACTNQGMPGSDSLPDCRAYEMVSPSEKKGQDVVPNSFKVFAAEVGDGASYAALGDFGDSKGTSVDAKYLARRTGAPGTNGWANHGINPPAGAPDLLGLVTANIPSFAAFSTDLSAGIYNSWGPLTDAPEVAGVSNLSRLRDLDSAQPQVDLLSASAQPLGPAEVFSKLQLQNAFAAASKDLGHVIFQSPWNLTGDGSFVGDPGDLYEYADGAGLRKVGRIPSGPATECDDSGASPCEGVSGVQPGLPVSLAFSSSVYSTGMISDDGSRILFKTPSTGDIYMREDGERTYQLNASERTTPGPPGGADVWGMSADGSRVFFAGGNLVDEDEDNNGTDLYMYEVEKPAGHRLTLLSADETGNLVSVSSFVGASADGHYVYFIAAGQLVAGEPSTVVGGLYLWHDGQISYIGQFEVNGNASFNTPETGWQFVSQAKTSRVSPDGRSLLFMSYRDGGFAGRGGYPGYDHGSCAGIPCRELYLYSADSGRLRCVSCNPRSDVAESDALLDVSPGVSAALPTQHLSHALSADGRHVFFSTQESLVSEDTNGKWDAYEYDVPTGAPRLISSGTDQSDSYFMDASPDGSDAFFVTRQQLVGWDNDSSYDLYDARVNGGFPEPVPVPAACEGESCLPATPPAPGASPTASQNAGPGNPKQPPCRKGTRAVKRHGKTRCMKSKKHHRRAKANRRAGR